MNAVEIEEAVSNLAAAPFDPLAFPYAFLEAFGNKETTLKRLRSGNSNQTDLRDGKWGAVLQRNNIHIELRHFSAEVARLALIIAEYQCDVLYRGPKLALAEFLPLDAGNWITCGNALRLDWLSNCPPTGTGVKLHADDLFSTPLEQPEIDFENEGGETYICGNPPYKGSKWQSNDHKADLGGIFGKRSKGWKSLDDVAGWFLKAADYGTHTNAATALVATNSICQGQQVPILWPLIFATGHSVFNLDNAAGPGAMGFRLAFGGHTTASIAYNASASTVDTALRPNQGARHLGLPCSVRR